MAALDFLAVGDTTVDEFIFLKDARTSCDVNDENCTITMRWADKIPYESAKLVPGVGNAANAAVCAARLGLHSGFVSNIGTDRNGDDVLAQFASEKVDATHVVRHEDIPTNHHYVLSYDSERTILIRHEAYPYEFPPDLPAPKALYFSSIAAGTEAYHDAVAAWLEKNSEITFAFQPGTFQMDMGAERLARIYGRTDIFICNKEEYQRILKSKEEDPRKLMEAMRAVGPKLCFLSDGRAGAYALGESGAWKIGLYPEPGPPMERTGAGDAFSATVVVALLLGRDIPEALAWGPINSMSVVQEIGAQRGLLTRAQLEEYLKNAPADYRATPL
ncbi:carbohydrate kinase family protein [Candidatus Kaiserbacteria bacterium]|nr:carbohydrate kinase family protein [Candidatus Kaiserbacteria bacterium]